MEEDFLVEVPKISGLEIGDVVEPTQNVSLQKGCVLRKGLVVKVDNDPSQDLLPLYFIKGLKTNVRSPLLLNTLKKSNMRVDSFPSIEHIDFETLKKNV
jgi:hypothetical protein